MDFLRAAIEHNAAHLWLYLPAALVLGALHGLEPGHSKTMMAAFIIAVKGTVFQAALLGLSAAFSHSLLIWVLAALALHYGGAWNGTAAEPVLQVVSGILVILMAGWMAWRVGRAAGHHDHGHSHPAEGDDPDPHARAHAIDIEKRFAGREVTTGQIVLFGLTGGLIPCPGALTVLLLCLHVKRVALGAALVLSFSAGLALTLVLAGTAAAWGARRIAARMETKAPSRLAEAARHAPYFSAALLTAIGLFFIVEGTRHLP